MATAYRHLPAKAPVDRIEQHDDVPQIPGPWELIEDPSDRPFDARAAWAHRETGQIVAVVKNVRPTQMHTPETSRDDTGYNARVYRPDTTGERDLSSELGSKDAAWVSAIRFMAKYPAGDYEIPELDTWDYGTTVEW
ncbi:hypothetical protein [Natronosalvus rutilus]|uniref:Uncharacterized protein n=1 Tax=Natronosalvus rutilus TaxID=2953753 RepID=A0A9E7NCK6_9EURY|nr:hypothetical protein [Natronosalvus rutilus]UTF55964.1 hypothetical protein NGM29_20955 [Natronosalvus rutilus]